MGLIHLSLEDTQVQLRILIKVVVLIIQPLLTILQAILKPLKLAGLAAAAVWGPDIADGLTAFTIANANKEARKRRKGTMKHIKDCDADAHNIRAILRKHGWIMSATNTGY